jgi:hypothetical protein
MKIIEIENLDGTITSHVIVETDTGFTSMPKTEYDKQQAEQSTPNLAGGE